jgi:prepilin-type processing-associated H-X9-DG protein
MYQAALWIIPVQDWFGYMMSYPDSWGSDKVACFSETSWPAGWGGNITDSVAQIGTRLPMPGEPEAMSTAPVKSFVMSIGTINQPELKLSSVDDTVNWAIVHDSGAHGETASAAEVAYPDICSLSCANSVCGTIDWVVCDVADCGQFYADLHFLANPELYKDRSRHLGGVNIGFLDGHAQWIASQQFLTKMRDREVGGVDDDSPNSICDNGYFPKTYPGVPTLY